MSIHAIERATLAPHTATALKRTLRVPMIVAPMFGVSGPRLVIEASRAGVIGAFPHVNARSPEELERWIDEIEAGLAADPRGRQPAPYAVNLLTHHTNPRFATDLAIVARRRPLVVIASVGRPESVLDTVHGYGGLVFADVVSLHHARRAARLGVDGMVLLCAGAGGQTGRLNPFAFVDAVREFYDGLIIVAGGIVRGRQVRAVEILGGDLAYCGTRFVATPESLAEPAHKRLLLEAEIDDVWDTDAVSGIPSNLLKSSLLELGLSPENRWLQRRSAYDWAAISWRPGLISSGHGVGAVRREQPCASIVDEIAAEYEAAFGATR